MTDSVYKPKYHLIMGRSEGLSEDHRKKIGNEMNRIGYLFSTFDDIANRFGTTLAKMEELNESK